MIFLTINKCCKRSLGKGNIFTSVCQEFCSQEGGLPVPVGSGPGGACSGVVSGGDSPPPRRLLLHPTHPIGIFFQKYMFREYLLDLNFMKDHPGQFIIFPIFIIL